MPIALEKSFYLDVDGVKVQGFIDRVDKLESGGLSIVDYKTNKELFTADYLDEDLQLTIYQLAAEQTWNLPVEKLTLYHLRSNTPCCCPPRHSDSLEQARRLVLEVAEDIAAGKFPATENRFCPCDFPEHCPYYRHRYLSSVPQQPTQEMLPGIAAAEAVERYASIQAEIKGLEKELQIAKQVIIDYCRAEGLNRVFGGEHEANYRMMEKTGFDEDEVRALLEPEGLWERVLCMDAARLKQLMADASLPPEMRKRLESLRRVVSSHAQVWLKQGRVEPE
jgi:putative RecB family exonuclease